MIFLDEENNQIGEDDNEPDWSVWRVDHYEDNMLEDGSIDSRTYCRKFTDEELEEEAHQELINLLPDAFADLSETVSDNAEDASGLSDAVAELSELVSNLVEGMKNNG